MTRGAELKILQRLIGDLLAKILFDCAPTCVNVNILKLGLVIYYCLLGFVIVSWGLLLFVGVRGYFCFEKRPRNLRYTNRRNKGLISVDRRTSLLSYLQYPVPYQSRLQRIYRSQCPKGDWIWCWAEAYRYAWTQRAVDIVAFQHRFWLRGVQSLSCRW